MPVNKKATKKICACPCGKGTVEAIDIYEAKKAEADYAYSSISQLSILCEKCRTRYTARRIRKEWYLMPKASDALGLPGQDRPEERLVFAYTRQELIRIRSILKDYKNMEGSEKDEANQAILEFQNVMGGGFSFPDILTFLRTVILTYDNFFLTKEKRIAESREGIHLDFHQVSSSVEDIEE